MSQISYVYASLYVMMAIPTFALREQKKDRVKERRNIDRIRMVLYLVILLALIVPIGIEGFGYTSINLFIVWLVSIPVNLAVYWILFILAYKDKVHVCFLDIVYAVSLCTTGLTMNNKALSYHCYLTLVILGGCLFVISVVQMINDRNRH